MGQVLHGSATTTEAAQPSDQTTTTFNHLAKLQNSRACQP